MSRKKSWILPTNEEFIREFAPELLDMPGNTLPPIKLDGRGARPTVFNFALDASDSMWMHYHTSVERLNQIINIGLQGYHRNYSNPMLVGGTLFSNKLIPLWRGFKPVATLGDEPLNLNLINSNGLRQKTALYWAMISAIFWTNATMEQIKAQEPSRAGGVQGKIIIVTDGANDLAPFEAKLVYSILDAVAPVNKRGRRKIEATLAFLKTDSGLNESAAQRIAEETGFKFQNFYQMTTGREKESTSSWYYFENLMGYFDLFEKQMDY